jgi:hypothetical protein
VVLVMAFSLRGLRTAHFTAPGENPAESGAPAVEPQAATTL